MSGFTDDKVASYKAICKLQEHFEVRYPDMEALLTRLTAAENCTESLNDLLHHGVKFANGAVHEADPELAKERYKTWLRSKGGAGE